MCPAKPARGKSMAAVIDERIEMDQIRSRSPILQYFAERREAEQSRAQARPPLPGQWALGQGKKKEDAEETLANSFKRFSNQVYFDQVESMSQGQRTTKVRVHFSCRALMGRRRAE